MNTTKKLALSTTAFAGLKFISNTKEQVDATKSLFKVIEDKVAYSVSIKADGHISDFYAVHHAISNIVGDWTPHKSELSLELMLEWSEESCAEQWVQKHVLIPQEESLFLKIDNHLVKVSYTSFSKNEKDGSFDVDPRVITLTTPTKRGLDAVLKFVAENSSIGRAATRRETFVVSDLIEGNYNYIPLRPKETIFLREGLVEEILGDYRQFISQKDLYRLAAMPYHRGYLFHGPPGTGKTSIARMLASEAGRMIKVLNIASLDPKKISTITASIPPGSIVLVEDLDTFGEKIKRKGGADSLGVLLNLFDGINTPDNTIFVATTNNIDQIDKALTRPGRFDKVMLIDYMDKEQFSRMVHTITGVTPRDGDLLPEVTPAAVSNVIRECFGQFDMLEERLEEFYV